MTMAKKQLYKTATSFFVPVGWTYLDSLVAVQRSLLEQLRNVELAIACEQKAEAVKRLTKPKRKNRKRPGR